MRERLEKKALEERLSRITPAYAGKTLGVCNRIALQQDHPRVCGKDCDNFLVITKAPGSPPRMRERH